ncbi:MAG: lipopolysaccharide biosynthesis protein [Candidatus Nanopelagicales bacterium]
MPRARPKPMSLFRALLYFVPSYFLAIGGSLALNVAAARILGTADFGYFVIVVNTTILIGQFSLVGVHRSGLREAARTDNVDKLVELRQGVRAVLLIPVPLAAVSTGAVIWQWRGGGLGEIATAAFSGLLVGLAAYQKLNANFLRGLGNVRAATLITGRSGGALISAAQALSVLVVAWLAPSSGLPGVLAGTTAGYVVPLAWASWLLRRSWPPLSDRRHRTMRDLKVVIRRDWKFSFSQTGSFLNSSVELWLAGALLSGTAASLLAAAQRIGSLLTIPSQSMQTVFSPAVARLAHEDTDGNLEPLVRTAATVAAAASAVIWLPTMVVPGLILSTVFGSGFESAVPVLMMLSTASLLSAISGMSGMTLSMSHHEGDVAFINSCLVGARLVSGVVCAQLWGLNGLAASAVSLSALNCFLTWYTVRKRLSISPHVTLRPRLSLLSRISG